MYMYGYIYVYIYMYIYICTYVPSSLSTFADKGVSAWSLPMHVAPHPSQPSGYMPPAHRPRGRADHHLPPSTNMFPLTNYAPSMNYAPPPLNMAS